MAHLCYYGCGREAEYFFKEHGRWCCESHANKCPILKQKSRQRAIETFKDSYKNKMRKLVAEGNQKCSYCGNTAQYYLRKNKDQPIFCCQETPKKCPDFGKHLSKKRKQLYKDNPELLKNMRQIVKDMGNNEEIQRKKRESMIQLHIDENFRINYEKGIKQNSEIKWNNHFDELVNKWGMSPEELQGLTTTQLYIRCKYRRRMAEQ
jgi:hypothetical protein